MSNEDNSNMFRIESGTQLTEGSQSTASFYHPLETPRTFFMSPTEVTKEQIVINPTKLNVAKVKYESVDSHIRQLLVNPGKKGTQQLPKLHIPRGERENNNAYYRQYMQSHKRDSPETLRGYVKSYKSNTRPNSRDLTVLFSHRERLQQDSNIDSYRAEKIVTIDESKWENSIRKEGHSVAEVMIKNQGLPLYKVQSLGLVQKQKQRIRLQKQIASIEESSSVPGNSKIRRSRTIGNSAQDQNVNEDVSVENHYEFVERPARVSSSPYILEGIRPSQLEKIGLRNPFPYPLNPNPVKSQGEIEENLRKAGFRSALAIVNPARFTDDGRLPVEMLMAREKLPLNQNISYSNSQSAVTTRDEKYRHPRSSIDIQSAGMPAGNVVGKVVSSEPRKLQRALSDVRSHNVSPFEEILSRPETRELNGQPAAKLKAKFRGEEAILNKLFNRKK